MPLGDEQAIRCVQAGDTEAFAALVVRHSGLVAAVCRRLLADDHEAMDAVQDTFVRAYLNLGQLKDPVRFEAWLRRVAYSVCMNRLKRRCRGDAAVTPEQLDAMEAPDGIGDPRREAEARELAHAVLAGIKRLPEEYRRPIEMFYLEGASGAEIADRLGLRAGAVRVRLSRGREMLRPELAKHWAVETISRTKQPRCWLPSKLQTRETQQMKLEYEKTKARLLRGDAEVMIRPMQKQDIAALRRFDIELTGTIGEVNAAFPPGGHSTTPGGPWSDDKWLAEHFDKYLAHGGMTLLAENADGRIVGFADLWPAEEPQPFGRSLNVECIDYFREYFLAGLETVLLGEAEKVAHAAGMNALDIGTNTCSGEYVSLRRFGLKVFYEYDDILCRCEPAAATGADRATIAPKTASLAGLVKVNHWSPTNFTFRSENGETHLVELCWPDMRAVVELWRSSPEADTPDKTELYATPEAMASPEKMSRILAECAAVAADAGAGQIMLSCPSEIDPDAKMLEIIDRGFAFAWLRKRL